MRETQFYICLVVTLGLLLLVIPVIFLLKKRLPTLQKKIFFAQVWLASMVVVLMPLYYHFYKVAMYYSVSVALLSLTIIGFAIIYYLTPDSDNPHSAYFESFASFCLFIFGIWLFIYNSSLSQSYLDQHNSEHLYGFKIVMVYLIFYTFYIPPLLQIYMKIKKFSFLIFYLLYILILVIFRFGLVKTEISLLTQYNPISIVTLFLFALAYPITIGYCFLSIYMLNKKSKTNLRLFAFSAINILMIIIHLIIVIIMKYDCFELLPSNLNIWDFILICFLNIILIVPYILMSHTILFTPKDKEVNTTQPTQIGNEPTNMS